jgi:hypothetical protein
VPAAEEGTTSEMATEAGGDVAAVAEAQAAARAAVAELEKSSDGSVAGNPADLSAEAAEIKVAPTGDSRETDGDPGESVAEAEDEASKVLEEGVPDETPEIAPTGLVAVGASIVEAVAAIQDVAREAPEQLVGEAADEAAVDEPASEVLVAERAPLLPPAEVKATDDAASDGPEDTTADATADTARPEESVVADADGEISVESPPVAEQAAEADPLSAGAVASVEQVIYEAMPGQ